MLVGRMALFGQPQLAMRVGTDHPKVTATGTHVSNVFQRHSALLCLWVGMVGIEELFSRLALASGCVKRGRAGRDLCFVGVKVSKSSVENMIDERHGKPSAKEKTGQEERVTRGSRVIRHMYSKLLNSGICLYLYRYYHGTYYSLYWKREERAATTLNTCSYQG